MGRIDRKKYSMASTDLKDQGCNKLEKKRDALATPDSVYSYSLATWHLRACRLLVLVLVMSETVMNGSVETYLPTAPFKGVVWPPYLAVPALL